MLRGRRWVEPPGWRVPPVWSRRGKAQRIRVKGALSHHFTRCRLHREGPTGLCERLGSSHESPQPLPHLIGARQAIAQEARDLEGSGECCADVPRRRLHLKFGHGPRLSEPPGQAGQEWSYQSPRSPSAHSSLRETRASSSHPRQSEAAEAVLPSVRRPLRTTFVSPFRHPPHCVGIQRPVRAMPLVRGGIAEEGRWDGPRSR